MQESAQTALMAEIVMHIVCLSTTKSQYNSLAMSLPCYRFSYTCGLEIEVDPYSAAHAS